VAVGVGGSSHPSLSLLTLTLVDESVALFC
jgi:hypothetical protein